MTTKEQERKALAQIREIVDGLGENSYIGMAFEGCFEIAERNIDNDFACSMKQRMEAAEFAEDELRAKVAKQKEMIDGLNKDHAVEIAEVEALTKLSDELNTKLKESDRRDSEHVSKIISQQSEIDGMKQEIIYLKAKLYDLMTK